MKLEEGMTFALETQNTDGLGQRVRIEEMVVATFTGAEVLSKFPVEEIIVCWRARLGTS